MNSPLDRFTRSLIASIAFHVLIFIVVFVRGLLFSSEPVEVRSALKVDLIALPDKEVELPSPTVSPPQPTPSAATNRPNPVPITPPKLSPKVDLKKTKSTQDQALKKLKQLEAIEKLQTAKPPEPPPSNQPIKGNALADGNSLEGMTRVDYDKYFGELEQYLKKNWDLPQWLVESGLRAQIHVLIDEQGFVLSKTIRTSSGNEIFDLKALQAIQKSSPFPPPPPRLTSILRVRGIVFNFPK